MQRVDPGAKRENSKRSGHFMRRDVYPGPRGYSFQEGNAVSLTPLEELLESISANDRVDAV